jgi:hypothetical protein
MGDSVGMVNRDDVSRLRRQVRTYAAIAITAVALAILAGVAAYFFATLASGDEPPIRVKGGSEDLIISYDQWEKDGSNQDWKPKNRGRGKDKLNVVVLYNAGAVCKGHYVEADKISVEYVDGSDTNSVSIKSTGNHLKVKSEKDLALSSSDTTLSYGVPHQGRISRLIVDGDDQNPYCTFGSGEDLDQILILDW